MPGAICWLTCTTTTRARKRSARSAAADRTRSDGVPATAAMTVSISILLGYAIRLDLCFRDPAISKAVLYGCARIAHPLKARLRGRQRRAEHRGRFARPG